MNTTITTNLTERIIATLRAHEEELRRAGIRHLSLFGSIARGNAEAASDVDLAAEFDPAARMDLFRLTALERRLGNILRPPRGPVARTGREAAAPGQHRSGPSACLLGELAFICSAWIARRLSATGRRVMPLNVAWSGSAKPHIVWAGAQRNSCPTSPGVTSVAWEIGCGTAYDIVWNTAGPSALLAADARHALVQLRGSTNQ